MYARLQDELLDHPKISQAGRALGKSGRGIAIGFYTIALMYCNRHLSDGYLAIDVVEGFASYFTNPLAIADALASAGLFEQTDGGYRIHDYREYNPTLAEIKRRRKVDRERKANGRA